MIGQQIHQFKILEKLGQGGMGEVYLAEDMRLERKVALKFLPPHYSKDPELKARFEHEARAAAALNHPNIITVYDLGEHAGRNFIAMELVEGKTLDALIKVQDITMSEAIDYAQQICEGLGAAHEAGIVHRDIKPANILVGKGGRVKILDFGLAKSRKATTETQIGTTVGTIQYESPEQSRGDRVDGRSDLFSLGVVLYEMITAHRPFKGEFEDAIRYAIAHESPEPLARYKASVPDDLQRIVSKLLEKDPELRYQSAAGVNSDIKMLKRTSGPHASSVHSAVAATATTSPFGASGQPRRRRLLSILVPSAVAVLVVVVALVFQPWKLEIAPSHDAVAAEGRLAVMYFDNLPDPEDNSRLGEMVTNLLITSLSESKAAKVLSSQRLYDILKQLGQEGSRRIDREMASQVAQKAEAKWMLTGTIVQTSPKLVLTAQVIDVASGQVEASTRMVAEAGEEIFSQVDRLAATLRADLPGSTSPGLDSLRSLAVTMTSSEEAYRLYLEGIDLLRKLFQPEARAKFLAAVRIDSTFAMAWFRLARNSSDLPEAPQWMKNAVRYSYRASELDRTYIEASSDFYDRNFTGAIAHLKRLLELDPEQKDAYYTVAALYANELNQPDSAIYYQKKVLEFDPLDKESHNNLAYYYKAVRKYDQALKYIDLYVRLVPDEPNPYDSRGEILLSAGRFDEAIASYRQALARAPEFAFSARAMFVTHTFLGDYAAADSAVRLVLRDATDPAFRAGARLGVALGLVAKGQLQKALEALDQGIAADHLENIDLREYLDKLDYKMELLSFLGRHAEALAQADEAVKESRRMFPAEVLNGRETKVYALAMAGRHDEASSLLQQLEVELAGKATGEEKVFFHLAQGWAALARGDASRAESVLVLGASLNRRNWRPLCEHFLAKAYLDLGRPGEAIPILDRATTSIESLLAWYPHLQVEAHLLLGRAYLERGKRDKAAEQFRWVIKRWQDGDPDLPYVVEAKERLAELGA